MKELVADLLMKYRFYFNHDEYFTLTRRNSVPAILLVLNLARSIYVDGEISIIQKSVYFLCWLAIGIWVICFLLFTGLFLLLPIDTLFALLKFIGDKYDDLVKK